MNKIKRILIIALCFSLTIGYCIINDPSRDIVLTFGTFAGSSWDVPNGDSYKVIDEAISKFEKKYPNVTIKYESGILKSDYSSWLSKKIVNGNQPDVFMVEASDFNTLSSIGALKNLDTMLKEEDINVNDFYPETIEAGKNYNHQFALPYETNPTMMCINTDLLEKENIEIPKDDWTIEEFYQICKKVTKDINKNGTVDQFGCYDFSWRDALASYGINLFNDDGTKCNLTQNNSKKALSYVQKLQELNDRYLVKSEDFDAGNVAFCPLTFAQYRTYQPYPYRINKYSTFDWSCIKMPGTKNNYKSTQMDTSLVAINSETTHEKYAMEFLKMLTYNQETQQTLFNNSQGVSPLKSVVNSKKTKEILQQNLSYNNKTIQINLNDIMESTLHQPKFKSYNSAMITANYYIGRSLSSRTIDNDLYDIQKKIDNYTE